MFISIAALFRKMYNMYYMYIIGYFRRNVKAEEDSRP